MKKNTQQALFLEIKKMFLYLWSVWLMCHWSAILWTQCEYLNLIAEEFTLTMNHAFVNMFKIFILH